MKTHYSITELAAFKLPGFPGSRQNMQSYTDRFGWSFVEVKSRGRLGFRREYQVPAHVLELIGISKKLAKKRVRA